MREISRDSSSQMKENRRGGCFRRPKEVFDDDANLRVCQ